VQVHTVVGGAVVVVGDAYSGMTGWQQDGRDGRRSDGSRGEVR
jgi:hypothetical protein